MLSVIPVILKYVGILLLFLLVLLLILLLLLLFVPVRYSGRGIYENAPEAEIRVSWLLKLVRFTLNYKDGIDAEARLGFLKLWSMKTGGKESGEDNAQEEYSDAELEEALEEEFPEEVTTETVQPEKTVQQTGSLQQTEAIQQTETIQETRPEEIPAEFTAPQESSAAEAETVSPPRPKKKKKYAGTPETLDEKFEKVMNKVYGVTDKIDEGIAFLNETSTKRLLLLLKKKLFRLLREICPRDYGGEVRFGFNDPFTTGQATSAAAILYPVYRDRIHVEPRFDREELFADLSLKGHIRLFPFAAAAAQIWFNRDFQTVFKRIKNRKKDDGGKHG
ncbi:MAG: DUF2953 domain-containing protein [Stomatobaculum sp.]|nr:DUF2953 domain-containing protein [Stomatobaculum sp.]